MLLRFNAPALHTNRLDRLYTLSDEGFRAPTVVDDSAATLPACFPEKYGDEFEKGLQDNGVSSGVVEGRGIVELVQRVGVFDGS